MNLLQLDGVRFSPITFTPTADMFANETCYGVQVHTAGNKTL